MLLFNFENYVFLCLCILFYFVLITIDDFYILMDLVILYGSMECK